MDAVGQTLRHLRIDVAVPHETAERHLDMPARAAETIIQIEMAKGCIEIITPEQADNAAAEPDAFRLPRPALDQALGLSELIDLALPLLDRIGRLPGLLLLLSCFRIAALGEGRSAKRDKGSASGGTENARTRKAHEHKFLWNAPHSRPLFHSIGFRRKCDATAFETSRLLQ
jgi:hypothetical protein